MESIPTICCRGCGEVKPHTREFFSPCKSMASGLYSLCKPCRAKARKAYVQDHPTPTIVQARRRAELWAQGLQECITCKEVLPATTEHFFASKVNTRPLERKCKRCRIRQCGEYARRTPEKQHQWRIQRYAKLSPERKREMFDARREWRMNNPGRDSLAGRNRRAADPEKYRAKSRAAYWSDVEGFRARSRAWQKSNPISVRATQARARARRRQAVGSHSGADVQAQLAAQGNLCYWCKASLILEGPGRFHADHLIPLARGGSNGPENIVCACPTCNHKKWAFMPWEFSNRLI